jgi:hypothetical protein
MRDQPRIFRARLLGGNQTRPAAEYRLIRQWSAFAAWP